MLNLKEFGEVFDFGMPQAPRNVGSVKGAIGDDPAGRWGPDLGVWARACAQSMYTGHVTGEERCHVQAGQPVLGVTSHSPAGPGDGSML